MKAYETELEQQRIEKNHIFNALLTIQDIQGMGTDTILQYLVPPTTYEDTKISHKGNNPVYIYEHKTTKERVAVKLLSLCTSSTELELREIEKNYIKKEFVNSLKCYRNNLSVKPLALAFNQNYSGMLMEDGGISLNKYWSTPECTPDSVIYTFHELAKALSYIHSQKIYHGDIKPQNILVKDNLFKFADFGGSQALGTLKTKTFAGCEITTMYMAPEILWPFLGDHLGNLRGVKHPEIDIYSLGLTMFALLKKRTITILESQYRGKSKDMDENRKNYHLFIDLIQKELEMIEFENEDKGRKLRNIILACLDIDPRARLPLIEIINELK